MLKNFCVLPWYSQEIDLMTGQEKACCWVNTSISRSELQQKFLSGQKPTDCQKCWRLEQQGVDSRRQMENRFLDFKTDRDIELLAQDVMQNNVKPQLYQLYMGSTCNGTCVTCGPSASSAWKSLIGQSFSIRQENAEIEQQCHQFWDQLNWRTARRFNLLGGEPLLIPRSFEILEKLLEVGNNDCRISFVTNGSIVLTKKQISLLSNFSDVSCCISIDGVGRVFEYLRYPLTWTRLLTNIETYGNIFSEITVSFTVSNLNYHVRSETIDWFRQQELLYIENYVSYPAWFDYRVGPDHDLWPKFIDEISKQDAMKGINIKDYIPSVHDLIMRTHPSHTSKEKNC